MIEENGVTARQADEKKAAGKHNPKLAVFREFVLASTYVCEKEHAERSSALPSDNGDAKRQFYACDLVAKSGVAGLQWKRHLNSNVHVTIAEQTDALCEILHQNVKTNGLTLSSLPLDVGRPAGGHLVFQAEKEVHVAQCDPTVLMQLEAFDFVYLDAHRNPSPFFSTLFRNIRNNGTVCIVVPDTMHFARSPHVVRRSYRANCIKTEYLHELAVRIILASLVTEAATCSKGVKVLYCLSFEDYLLLCVRVERGAKYTDATLPEISSLLHCRICEERTFYPTTMAPVEDPYSLLSCDCQKNVPGKTGVILGPLWQGRVYDYQHLTKLAEAGRSLGLSLAFFTLLQKSMEDCLCDEPPTLQSLQNGPERISSDGKTSDSATAAITSAGVISSENHPEKDKTQECNAKAGVISSENNSGQEKTSSSDVKSCADNATTAITSKNHQDQDQIQEPSAKAGVISSENHSGQEQNQNLSEKPEHNGLSGKPGSSEEISATEQRSVEMASPSSAAVKNGDQCVEMSADAQLKKSSESVLPVIETVAAATKLTQTQKSQVSDDVPSLKRTLSDVGEGCSPTKSKKMKTDDVPTPTFYYNIHSKRLGKNHIPKHQVIVQCLRAHGYRCCRTHFEKYAIRTNANLKTLVTLLGSGESKVVFVRGEEANTCS